MSEKSKQQVRADGLVDVLTGLGTTRDRRMNGYMQAPLAVDQTQLETLYAGDPMAQRIVRLPATEQTRQWVQFKLDDEQLSRAIEQHLQVLGVQRAVTKALIWARLYGGSAILLGADDGGIRANGGENSTAEPLNETNIRSLRSLRVLHRFALRRDKVNNDFFSPNYGEPETYSIASSRPGSGVQNVIVHASRLIRFDGLETPQGRREAQDGWDDSALALYAETLVDFWRSYNSTAHLMSTANQDVFAIKGLAAAVSSLEGVALVVNRLQAMDQIRSVIKAIAIDKDNESLERHAVSFDGIPEVLDKFAHLLAAITGIPVALLMGQAPAGLNATGDSDIRFFYDAVAAAQQNDLRPKLERLFRVCLLAKDGPTKGVEPESWSFDFKPLWQESDAQRVENRRKQAETDQIYIANGVVRPSDITASRFMSGEYSYETAVESAPEPLDVGGVVE